MRTRTSQGAIAWAVRLVPFPYLAVPAYWVFGRSKFRGYVWRGATSTLEVIQGLAEMPVLGPNGVERLIAKMEPGEYERKPCWFRLGVHFARLTVPIQ